MKTKHMVAASLLLGCSAIHAVTVFSDDFEADTAALNKSSFLGGWVVSDGSVDLVQNFVFAGKVVDLDGSTGDAGVFSKSLTLTGGTTYTASFVLAGSQRGSTETVEVSFGAVSDSFTLASADPFGLHSLSFTPAAGGSYALSFANTGGDNVGLLLDNVSVDTGAVAPIPEPSSYGLLLAGLLAVGAAARRRRA